MSNGSLEVVNVYIAMYTIIHHSSVNTNTFNSFVCSYATDTSMFSLDGTSFLFGVMRVNGISYSVLLFPPLSIMKIETSVLCVPLSLADLNKRFVPIF